MSISHCAAAPARAQRILMALGGLMLHLPPAIGAASLTISGRPITTIATGTYLSFQPAAVSTAGRPLSFSIANKPGWAQFDSSTGRLFGSVTLANLGLYDRIVISVTDGAARASLAAFPIVVVANPSYSTVVLDWQPPTVNTDASPLVDLAGYHIYFGNAPNALSNRIDVANPGLASYVIIGLGAGTWYFALSGYNSGGAEGELSEVISRVMY